MEIIRHDQVPMLTGAGAVSYQLVSAEHSASTRVSVTRVVLEPGAINPRHRHPTSEQIWVALSGEGVLLLADDKTLSFTAGDVARFEDGETHGFQNTGVVPFEYLAVTSPPVDFRPAYDAWRKAAEGGAAE